MERIKAGLTPPPHPQLKSRESALFPREANVNLLPYTSTQEFRVGNEGLFAAVRSELSQTIHYIPETPYPHHPNQLTTVGIASGNNHKVDSMLSEISNHQLAVVRIPEAQEWHTQDVILDATSKAISAADFLQNTDDNTRREVRTRPFVTMANDQMNAIPVMSEHSVTHLPIIAFERHGKPQREYAENPTESVRQTFQHMADLAEKYHWKSVPYLIELATVIHNPQDPDNNALTLQKSAVFLSPEGLKHLATDRFDEYVALVQEHVGKTNGKAGVTDIAAGLEFGALDQMSMIDFVSGTPSEIESAGFPPEQREYAKAHAYSLALATPDQRIIRDYFGTRSN